MSEKQKLGRSFHDLLVRVVQRELKHVAFVLHIWYHGVSNARVDYQISGCCLFLARLRVQAG